VNHKILLVYDDYSEMIRVQTDLMKVGFDVVGIVNEALLMDQLLVFNPELVITAGRGGKVSASNVAQKLRDNARFHGKVMVLLPPSQRPSAEELARIRMDALLELPCPALKTIQVIARLLSLDTNVLIEKYRRAKIAEGLPESELPSLRTPPPDRASRFEKALKEISIDPTSTTFDRDRIKKTQENLKKDWDLQKLEEIDEQKKKFVRALFKK
jgi:hypothetical protein